MDHVTLKNSVLARLLTAQRIYTFRMDLYVMITRPTATQESARRTMDSARQTLHPTKAMMRALKTTIQMEITMETVAQMELTSLHVLAAM
jgi:hypothetical protein